MYMSSAPTFKSVEHAGWNARATSYDDITAIITNYGIVPLLDAAGIAAGQKVLDVCCGTGLVAAAAMERGAMVTAIDIAEDMIMAARAKGLPADFRVGDAEALAFPAASFDRVVCNFGLFHVPEPDKAIAEAARVLRPGGRYAFTTWCGPEVSPIQRIIPEAIKVHGKLDVGLPPAPPPYRLADRSESEHAMRAAGFTDVVFADVAAVLEWPLAEIMDFIEKGLVRATMLLFAQTPQARQRIKQAIERDFAVYAVGGKLRLPVPALVVAGEKA
jgi:SAM-dependent methyltransferase